MKDEYRSKAALAIFALANRTVSAGRKEAGAGKGPKWQPMPYGHDEVMDVEKLREAACYFEIAESIHAPSVGGPYQRALLLERMGAWDDAIPLFVQMGDAMGESRCRRKQAGTYDELDDLPEGFRDMLDKLPDADEVFANLAQKHGLAPEAGSGSDIDADDPVVQFAQSFVERLVDRDWAAAKKMLHKKEKLSAKDLKEYFEGLFIDDEEFPTTCSVFDVRTDGDDLEPTDIAWIYVTIHSEQAEAVSLYVADDGKGFVARAVEFGRP